MVDGNLFPYTGAITFADPSYNSTTGTFLLRATVNNPAGVLRPNQYVRVRLKGAIRPNAIVIPQRAVQQSAKGHFVWVVNKDNQAELRPVVVGEWKGDGWLISEGLDSGDKVVVDGGDPPHARRARSRPSPYVPASAARPARGSRRREPRCTSAATPSQRVHLLSRRGQATLDADAQRAMRVGGGRVRGHRHADHRSPATPTRPATPRPTSSSRRSARMAVRDELVQLGVEPRRIQLDAAGQASRAAAATTRRGASTSPSPSRRPARPMFSRFFIERPIFAAVVAHHHLPRRRRRR